MAGGLPATSGSLGCDGPDVSWNGATWEHTFRLACDEPGSIGPQRTEDDAGSDLELDASGPSSVSMLECDGTDAVFVATDEPQADMFLASGRYVVFADTFTADAQPLASPREVSQGSQPRRSMGPGWPSPPRSGPPSVLSLRPTARRPVNTCGGGRSPDRAAADQPRGGRRAADLQSTLGTMASRTAKTPARRYTETKVPILDSQLELKVLMEDARDVGLTEPEWEGGDGPTPVLRFRIDGRPCVVVLRPDEHEDDQEAELRRLHRVLLHFVKNAIEAARSRLFGVREALLAWHITTDGKMLGETVFAPGSAGRSITLALPEAKAPAPSRTLPAAKSSAAPSRALPAAKAPAAPSRALLPGPTARRRRP